MKRIVLFVEGDGEVEALPKLIKRLLTAQDAWGDVILDPHPFRVGHINALIKKECGEWHRKLAASLKRKDVGGVLLVLDGDVKKIGKEMFCAAKVAKQLASEAKKTGGGTIYSVAVVFARQEFESWLIAGFNSLAGKRLPDGRLVAPAAKAPVGDLEENPRDAKGWLGSVIEGGYKPTTDQAALVTLVDLDALRSSKLRSFRRLENALSQLISAIRSGAHIATPS